MNSLSAVRGLAGPCRGPLEFPGGREGGAGADGAEPRRESFWGRMQVELLNRRRWRTRVELANAIFEYIEGFHNRRRRHSAIGWATPLEFESEHRILATTPHDAFRETGA